MLQSCHIPYLGSHSSYTEVAPLKVYKMPHLMWISLHIHSCLRYTCSSIQSASPLTPLKCAALNSAALPWALQHLLVGKLPAVSSVPWKLMRWIMRFSRYLQVPWQIRVLDFFFPWACLWGGFLSSVSIMNPSLCRFHSWSVCTFLSQSFVSARINYSHV